MEEMTKVSTMLPNPHSGPRNLSPDRAVYPQRLRQRRVTLRTLQRKQRMPQPLIPFACAANVANTGEAGASGEKIRRASGPTAC